MMQNHLVARLIEAGVDERITGAMGRFVDQVTAHGVPEERDRTFLVLVSEQLLAQVKAGRPFKAAVTCLLVEINAARTLLGIELSHYQHPVSRRAFFMLAKPPMDVYTERMQPIISAAWVAIDASSRYPRLALPDTPDQLERRIQQHAALYFMLANSRAAAYN